MKRKLPTDAFDYYVTLGSHRSYQAVADHFGVSKRTVIRCAARENWIDRLAKIEQESRERGDKRLAETLDEMRERHLRTLRAMNARALAALKQYPLTSGMEAMRAAEIAIKLERLVAGEASERTELSLEEITKRELESWLESGPGGTEPDADAAA